MKVLVIPDIHLKPWIFNEAEKLMKEGAAEKAVCLMDIADDWNMGYQIQLYEEAYDRAIKFAKDFPETLWCYGNHDISYVWGLPETGYSSLASYTVTKKMAELKNIVNEKLAFIHRIDITLFSHGGLPLDFVRRIERNRNKKLINIYEVVEAVNMASPDELWNDDSPIWFRPQYMPELNVYKEGLYTQVVGHTPVAQIYKRHGIISTDTFSTTSGGKQIGPSQFAVVDTKTGSFKVVSI